MAFVIEGSDPSGWSCRCMQSNKRRFNQSQTAQIKNNLVSIFQTLPLTNPFHPSQTAIQHIDHHIYLLRHFAHKIYKNLSLLITVRIDSLHEQIFMSSKLMGVGGGLGKVCGRQRRKLVTKYLCSRGGMGLGEGRMAIDVETGQLKFSCPTYRLGMGSGCTGLNHFIQLMVINLGQQLRAAAEQLQLVMLLDVEQFRFGEEEVRSRTKDSRIAQTNRFFQFTNVFLNLASETANEELDLNVKLRKEADSLQKLKESRLVLGGQFRSVSLFSNMGNWGVNVSEDELQLTFLERSFIGERLSLPLNQRSNDPLENYFVLNYIKVSKKLSETMVKKIKVGGFTTIFLSEIQYWYVGSCCAGVVMPPENFEATRPLRKYIIIKREERNVSGKSRVAHERFILTKIKFGLSMFLPKYYLLAEKDNFYENDLLVDYIPSPNLSQYIIRSRLTLSFSTKLYFIWTIAQALRYLKEYSIVHLDLKPSNIMTHRRLCLKLIDFGQSYHPDLRDMHHPGFSMPYSAPENYIPQVHYDYKSDVFSLGIIMYELFFNKYPFFLHDETLRRRVYTQGVFQEYWFEVPEEALANGDPIIMPILYSVMLQCLREDPRDRPELEWIALLFREFIELLR